MLAISTYQQKREVLTPILHDAITKIAAKQGVSVSDLFNTASRDICLILSDLFDEVPDNLSNTLVELFVEIKKEREKYPDMIAHMRGSE